MENFYKEIKIDGNFYAEAAKHVIAWNAKAHGGITPNSTQEMFENQISLVREELKEFQLAATENNHIELLDAAADAFVVSSYLAYMFFGEEMVTKTLSTIGVGDVFSPTIYNDFLTVEENFDSPEQMALLSLGIMRSSRDTLVRSVYNDKKVMKEVLKSNDSKYPTRKQLLAVWETKDIEEALEKECRAIEERSLTREEGAYTGVTYVYNPVQKVYAFFDDKGKIMKPSTFVKPNIAGIVNKAA